MAAAVDNPTAGGRPEAERADLYRKQSTGGGDNGAGEAGAGSSRRYTRSEIEAVRCSGGGEDGGGSPHRWRYTREELEAVGLAMGEDVRQKRWGEIYGRLAPFVARELDQIFVPVNLKRGCGKINGNENGKKKIGVRCSQDVPAVRAGVISRNCLYYKNEKSEDLNALDNACDDSFFIEDGEAAIEDVFEEEEDSDEEYSIRRPAFLVVGEPDFESGPPQDGLEYLRRVRWETARIPKVKVASLSEKQVQKEQTPYMPSIPDIARCPDHLMPSKIWEDLFLEDFSRLRQDLFQLETSSSVNPSSFLFDSSALEDSKGVIRNWPKITSPPMLSIVLQMEPASRASMLRNRILSLDNGSTLSRETCLWLFALCAVVDTPFDADTSASIRCLLRKCASLRAAKDQLDDEVVMLNMLISLAGKYFGQAEIWLDNCLP